MIDKEVRGTLDGERSLWLRHPETSKTLCDALVVESNTKIRELLVVVLGVMYSRNIRDPRIFEAVLPLVSSSETNLSRLAVIAISDSTDVRKWAPLLSLFRNCKTQKMMDALLMHLWQIPAEYKKLIIEILIGYFVQKKLTGESGRNIAQAIYSFVDENLIGWFRLQYHKSRTKGLNLGLVWADEYSVSNPVMHEFLRDIHG